MFLINDSFQDPIHAGFYRLEIIIACETSHLSETFIPPETNMAANKKIINTQFVRKELKIKMKLKEKNAKACT